MHLRSTRPARPDRGLGPRRRNLGRDPRRPRPAVLVVALALIVGVGISGCRYTADIRLPSTQAVSSEILWDNGTVLTTLHAGQDREPVTLASLAPVLPRAVVAIEDARYYDHGGVDPRGVIRALTRDVKEGNTAEGGSTITQQYVRAVMLGPRAADQKTLERKLHEAVLAIQVERKYSKNTILERYLNTVYFGNGAYGVQAAAETYFARSARDVNLAQAATIAGIIRSPDQYDPYVHPAATIERRNEVLDRMLALHRVSTSGAASAMAAPLGLAPRSTTTRYPAAHFVERVKDFIASNPAFGTTPDDRLRELFEGGLRIHTTLDPQMQAEAEQAIARVVSQPATDPEAALVSLDPVSGAVRAYVGGPDFFGTEPFAKVDLAGGGCRGDGQGCRQAGSTFKAFVLAAALERGLPLTKTYAAPAQITIPIAGQKPWVVHNYDGESFGGSMDLTEATVNSVNTVYAQLVTDIGAQPVVDLAHRMGVASRLAAVPSAALGVNGVTVLDMASAYDTLAGDGLHAPPMMVTEVTAPDGTVLWRAPVNRTRVLPPAVSRTITDVLQQVVERGTGVNARIGRPVAGKTGTGDDWDDAWFVGYTPQLVTAVWIGFPQGEISMRPPTTRITVTGGTWPAQIWQQYAGAALASVPAVDFPTVAQLTPSTTTTTSPDAGPTAIPVVGMTLDDATRLLVNGGYRVQTTSAPSRTYPPNVVTAQVPSAGSPAPSGALVILTVSSGPPPPTSVPSVLDTLSDQAVGLLQAADLQTVVTVQAEPPPGNPARAGRVWKQSPIAGTTVDANSTVTVWVNPG